MKAIYVENDNEHSKVLGKGLSSENKEIAVVTSYMAAKEIISTDNSVKRIYCTIDKNSHEVTDFLSWVVLQHPDIEIVGVEEFTEEGRVISCFLDRG